MNLSVLKELDIGLACGQSQRIYLARNHSIGRWDPVPCCIFHIMCLSLLFPFLKQLFILISFCFATPFVGAQLALKMNDLPFAGLVIVILLC
jgi:hypothetical protein